MHPTPQLSAEAAAAKHDLLQLCRALDEPTIETLIQIIREEGLDGQDSQKTFRVRLTQAVCQSKRVDPESREAEVLLHAIFARAGLPIYPIGGKYRFDRYFENVVEEGAPFLSEGGLTLENWLEDGLETFEVERGLGAV